MDILTAVSFLVLLAICPCVHSQALECCSSKLVDSSNNVVVESGLQLTPGTYSALVVKLCIAEPLQVQVWTKLTDDQYVLKWSVLIDVTANLTRQQSVVISFTPFTITSDDRLALYSPGNSFMKIPVPFLGDPSSTIRLSNLSYNRIAAPMNISLQSWNLKGSFSGYLKLCTSASGCPALASTPPSSLPSSYSEFITVPANCCNQTNASVCNEIANKLKIQRDIINVLIEQINKLKRIIEIYLNGTRETSYCPDNSFIPGTYGLGYCYKLLSADLQLAQANIQCSSLRSRLVFIKDLREDNFLKDLVLKSVNKTQAAGLYRVWTSAIYSRVSKDWFWFNNLLPRDNLQSFGAYTNWKNRQKPFAVSERDVCATYVVDVATSTSYWEKAICTEGHPYICKIRKLCL